MDILGLVKGDYLNIVELVPKKLVNDKVFDIFVSNQSSGLKMRTINELHRHRNDHDPIFSRRFSEWYQMVSTSLKESGYKAKEN